MKQPASKFSPSSFTLPALALCLTPLIAMPVYAADSGSQAPAAAATRATFDKESGRLRAPEADEQLPAAAQGATSRSAAPQSMLRSPNALRFQAQTMAGKDGSETRRLDLSRALRFSVVHRHADGSLHKDCVVGEEGVAAHLSEVAPARESNHE